MKVIRTVLFVTFLIILGACSSSKKTTQTSVLDNEHTLIQLGEKYLSNKNYGQAISEFRKTLALNNESIDAYSGLAEAFKNLNQLDSAFYYITLALDIKESVKDLKIKSEVLYLSGQYDKALDIIKDGLNSDNSKYKPPLLILKGDILKKQGLFNNSRIEYLSALKYGALNTTIDNKLSELNELEKIFINSPDQIKNISKQVSISREELAVLLITELNNLKLNIPTESDYINLTDLKKSDWSYNAIQIILKNNLMEVIPNNSFHPREKLTRAQFAKVIESILLKIENNKSLATQYYGNESQFKDVNKTSPYYNAIILSTSRNLLHSNDKAMFLPDENIRPSEVIKVLSIINEETND